MSPAEAEESHRPHHTSGTSIDTLVAAIRSGPQGADVGAVFDLSAVADLRAARRFRRGSDRELAEALFEQLCRNAASDAPRALERTVAGAAGRTPDELRALGERLFKRHWYDRLYPEVWRLISEHIAAGHTVLLIGTATEDQLRPAATALGITHVLGARPAVSDDGRLTGRIDGRVPYGPDKAAAVADFAATRGLDPRRCYVYTGCAADLALLSSAATPTPIAPDAVLAAAADDSGWAVPVLTSRTEPSNGDHLRTVLGFAAMLAGALFGVLRRAHTCDRRAMADSLLDYGTRWPLRLCGVRMRVTGAEHARGPRPAIFLFNHQSQFDVLLVPAVIGPRVTGVGKKELIRNPVFGPLMRFVGVTFIDRSNTDRAKASLAPVVHTLRGGLSVAIAPEGTRSYTPRPGHFKKGAFHMAAQAGVPVIPVVLRNAADIGRRDSMIARPGTVDIAILPPIDVSAWDPAEMDAEVEAVRQQYVDTLRDWPGRP